MLTFEYLYYKNRLTISISKQVYKYKHVDKDDGIVLKRPFIIRISSILSMYVI